MPHPETSRRGNAYGITGMAIAVLATVLGPEVNVIGIIIVCMLIGGTIGFILSLKVQMTQMPELVAILHSLVGVAASITTNSKQSQIEAMSNPRFIQWRAGSRSGLPEILPLSLPKAMTEPEKVTAPINTPM